MSEETPKTPEVIPEPTPAPAPAAAAASAVSAATTSMTESVSAASDSVKSSVSNLFSRLKGFSQSSAGLLIVILIVGTAVALITGYVLYRLINKTINNRQSYLLPQTKIPLLGTNEATISADGIPNSMNGVRSTICFWIYIYDINKYAGSPRHILHRGDEADNYMRASPYIYIDPNTNKIHVTFASTNRDLPSIYGSQNAAYLYAPKLYTLPAPTGGTPTVTRTGAADNATDDAIASYLNTIHGITIDYVPLQRWVHIAVVVNEELNGGSITAYVDGELKNAVNSHTPLPPITTVPTVTGSASLTSNNSVISITPSFDITTVDLNKKGNVYVGGSLTSSVGAGFSGLVGKIEFFNYDLNAQDVYNNYLKGPIDNLLARLGLPPYGVRSPIYAIS